jgi:hypothetical protein
MTEPSTKPALHLGMRVRSADYGTGTVVAFLGIGVQVYWDADIGGVDDAIIEGETHLAVHDRSLVEGLERIAGKLDTLREQ